ncbi:MAG: spore cortex biosynthesis protein YabQ [Clostridiales bacterium]|jgi:spore cortex biosynthesis protein YabQ|nr:spore cortex biosynthesis protein YabQ [Clostridiales bacterium]
MEVTVASQFFVFVGSLVCGFILGIIFDLFRIHRRFFRVGKKITTIQDIMFGIIAALVVLQFMLAANDGEVRAFELASIGIGGLIYFAFLSRVCTKICMILIGVIRKTADFLFKVVLFPVLLVYKILRRPCILAIGLTKKSAQRAHRRAIQQRKRLAGFIRRI